jgi:hypothetical protein
VFPTSRLSRTAAGRNSYPRTLQESQIDQQGNGPIMSTERGDRAHVLTDHSDRGLSSPKN